MKPMKETFENDLNTQGFPYQEAYWKDMEKLLDKRRKPIVFFKRLALILLLTGAVVLSYTLLEKSSRIAVIKAKSVLLSITRTATRAPISIFEFSESGLVKSVCAVNDWLVPPPFCR